MAIPRQLTQIAFAAGLDESTEDEVLDPSAGFPVLQNVRQDRRGGVSKRLGFAPVVSTRIDGTARTEGRRLFTHKGAPCVVNSGSVDLYAESAGKSVSLGRVPDASIRGIPLPAVSDTSGPIVYDISIANGFVVLVYLRWNAGSSSTRYVVTDTDGVQIKSGSVSTTDGIIQLGTVGNSVFLASSAASGGSIDVLVLDCTSTTTIDAGWTLIGGSALVTNRRVLVTPFSAVGVGSRFLLAYVSGNSIGPDYGLTVLSCDASGVLETRVISVSGSPDGIVIAGSDTLWVAWNEAATTKAIGIDPASLSTTLASQVTVATTPANPGYPTAIAPLAGTGKAIIFGTWIDADATVSSGSFPVGMYRVQVKTVAGAGVVDVSERDLLGVTVAAQPFVSSSRAFAPVQLIDASNPDIVDPTNPSTTTQPSACLALCDVTDDADTLRPIGNFYQGLAQTSNPNGLASGVATAHAIQISGTEYAHAYALTRAASAVEIVLVRYNFADRFCWRPAAHNGVTFLSGGLLSYTDGTRFQECSFMHPPQHLRMADTGGGTGPTGNVTYVAVFESIDGAGNLTISGVSLPWTTTAAGGQIEGYCDPLVITSREVVRVRLYRTKASGKIYYAVGSHDVGVQDAIQGSTAPHFIDTLDDTTLAFQPLLNGTGVLPGTGGAPLQREAPPYCADVVSFAGMLVVASGSDLWWSGQTIGGEGTWFSEEQFVVTVEGDGDIAALLVADGTLYVFKERAIWTVAGEAPSDNGSAGGLGTPRRLAGDVGCIEPSSVVVTSMGIFFRSHRGIELLSRGGSPSWIGEQVRRTLATYPYITSAATDIKNTVVRFSLASSITDGAVSGDGRDVVYDLSINTWQSIDDKYGSAPHEASQDACVVEHDGALRYAWLGSNGALYVENDEYKDNGVWITMAAETGWFKVSGIQGKQQINSLTTMMRKHTDADVSIALGYNYSTEYNAARTWTFSEIADLLDTKGWPITQLRNEPSDDSDGQSVRIRIEDAFNSDDGFVTGTGRGATWLALTLDLTPKDGPFEMPEEAT